MRSRPRSAPGQGAPRGRASSLNQGYTGLDAVACPDIGLCLAPDATGNAAVSTDPDGAARDLAGRCP